jgi:cellulose synthase (UDP-forming)
MDLLLLPTAAVTSILWILLTAGALLAVSSLLSPERTGHRTLVFGVALLLALRYLYWRTTQTLAPPGWTAEFLASAGFLVLEMTAALGSLSSFVLLCRTRERSAEVDRLADGFREREPPKVAVLIATYNEGRDELEHTLLGALRLDYPSFEVCVLDDGGRPWLRELCERRGARYFHRTDRRDAKAGNLNDAWERLRAEPDPPAFLAVLDADFVPHRNFLQRTLPLFADPSVGLVQTPQHFFNTDPVQHNLGLSRSYPDEQRFFFDTLQPARDAWGIAFCCGTSSVVRTGALATIGGFPTGSVTEDFLLTLALQEKGFHTAYLNEPLSEGLAPEGLREYLTQRSRWCLGLFQIARGRLGPFHRNGLRWRDRWSVLDAVLYWTGTFSFRLAALGAPLLFWLFDLTLIQATLPEALSYFGLSYLWTLGAIHFASHGKVLPFLTDASQLVAAPSVLAAVRRGLFSRRPQPFRVTAKGGDRSRVVVQWRILVPLLILAAFYLAGLLHALVFPVLGFREAGEGKWIVLGWTIYNLVVLGLTLLLAVEVPRLRTRTWTRPRPVQITGRDGAPREVDLLELSLHEARVQSASPPGEGQVVLNLGESLPDLAAVATEDPRQPGHTTLLLEAEPAQYDALLALLYGGERLPTTLTYRIGALLRDLLRRLATPARLLR